MDTLRLAWEMGTGEFAPVAALLFASVVIFYDLWVYYPLLSPDGERYIKMGRGEQTPRPFCLRWLMPIVCKGDTRKWMTVNYFALAISAVYVAMLSGGLWGGLFAAMLFTGLQFYKTSVAFIVLTDATAFAFSLASALMFHDGHTIIGVVLALLAGACRESSPVFIACWTLEPLALIGVAGAAWWRKAGKPDAGYLLAPFKSSRERHAKLGMNYTRLVSTWGAVPWLFAWLSTTTDASLLVPALLSLAVAYGQMIIANDYSRLYQWAWPALAPICAQTPEQFAVVALIAHFSIVPQHTHC